MNIKMIAGKARRTYKDYGLRGLIDKTKKHIIFKREQKNAVVNPQNQAMKDILFISGCNLPHPERYRVDHQIMQFEAFGLSCDKVFYADLTMDRLKYYRGFVFYRCPILPVVEEFIKQAKENNKTVFYDIDDLVFDKQYTDQIPYVMSLEGADRELYDDGVIRMGKTMKLCEYGIASTNRIKTEMEKTLPEAYVNRNVASEEMVYYSEEAKKKVKRDEDKIIIGYFSGTITHNEDFAMIQSVIVELLKKYENLYLKIVGLLDLPPEMEEVKDRILVSPFVDWRELPKLICSVDINIVPLEDSIFNEAKSENKWTEASLVEVPTIASNVGALSDMIETNKTGILCENTNDAWRKGLEKLIKSAELRRTLGKNAYEKVKNECTILKSGKGVVDFVNSKLRRNALFVLPSVNVSGGVIVATKHAEILKRNGWDVTILNAQVDETPYKTGDTELLVVSAISHPFFVKIDTLVATMWLTLEYVLKYPFVKNRKYLVQNYEAGFYDYREPEMMAANATYNNVAGVQYLTISKWVEGWLKKSFGVKEVKIASNGINLKSFKPRKRKMSGKIKILIEGSSSHDYKNVDESFRIAEKLDPEKYEIRYLSYDGKPKSWYRIDKMYYKISPDEVHKVYEECDILLKSSILESFSYPPLEMMTSGGYVVAVLNGGNKEYLKDEENCLIYEQGNIDEGVKKIEQIVKDGDLRNRLYAGGRKTAETRDWQMVENAVLALYK